MVEANNADTIKRDIGNIAVKGGAQPVKIAIMVEMFGVDIGDNANRRGQAHKCAIALIGFNNHPIALPQSSISAIGVNNAAINHGRVETGRV